MPSFFFYILFISKLVQKYQQLFSCYLCASIQVILKGSLASYRRAQLCIIKPHYNIIIIIEKIRLPQERERRRQHTTFIRQLDSRRRWEERERRKHQNLLDRLLAKEKKLQSRRKEMELLSELRYCYISLYLSYCKKIKERDPRTLVIKESSSQGGSELVQELCIWLQLGILVILIKISERQNT